LTSEQENIAKKYGGVYVFDEKLEKEIDKREEERDKVNKEILKEVSNIQDKEEQNKQLRLLLQEKFYDNPKLERVLSNGKKYYVTTRDYGNDFKKQAWIPREYSEKINDFIGKENLEKIRASKLLSYFYADNDNGDIVPIVVSVYYNVPTIVFGLYGDEASGIKFSKTIINDVGGDDYFYLIDNKFQKVNK
ncbi:MAG: tRNA 2-selenouridine synthase, partial [Campylobacter concisus]|nr:tRNA 2-selenouridine synthase [Campylobacter concisus]